MFTAGKNRPEIERIGPMSPFSPSVAPTPPPSQPTGWTLLACQPRPRHPAPWTRLCVANGDAEVKSITHSVYIVNPLVESPEVYGEPLPDGLLEDLGIVYRNCNHFFLLWVLTNLSRAQASDLEWFKTKQQCLKVHLIMTTRKIRDG